MAARVVVGLILFAATCVQTPAVGAAEPKPWRADHHMHLASADLCRRVGECLDSNHPPAVYAADAVRALDAAHVAKGVILSCAYLYGMRSLHLSQEEVARRVRAENEFTAAEIAKYPDRLAGFLSLDPLQPGAIDEMRYWSGKHVFGGLKLHFHASGVNIRSASDREKVKQVLAEAAKENLPVVMHVGGGDFNASDAELFIKEVLPSAGNSWVQIAHAGGGLPQHDGNNLKVLQTFADHIVQNDPRTKNVLFDVSYVPDPKASSETLTAFAREMRRIGIKRFLFGSDFNVLTPAEEISNLKKLGLNEQEWETLQGNCAPWGC
jgi:predicted TIM-barrel fold metal-dependent hydrolase